MQMTGESDRLAGRGVVVGVWAGMRERERERQDASVFDWPVAFTKVKLMVANCTLAKCSEEHVNHKK